MVVRLWSNPVKGQKLLLASYVPCVLWRDFLNDPDCAVKEYQAKLTSLPSVL